MQEKHQIVFNITKEIENQRNKLPQILNEQISNYLAMIVLKTNEMPSKLLDLQISNMQSLRKRVTMFLFPKTVDAFFPMQDLKNGFEMLDQQLNQLLYSKHWMK